MSIDLSTELEAAKSAQAESAAKLEALDKEREVLAATNLESLQRLQRIEKALAVLNGEDSVPEPAPQSAEKAPAPPPAPKKPPPSGPYASFKCSACQEVGKMREMMRQTAKGGVARYLECAECGNQSYLGS